MRTLLIILTALVFTSCKTTKSTNDNVSVKQKQDNLTIIEINAGHNSAYEEATQKVVNNNDELQSVWEIAYRNYMKKPPLPEVDFENYDIILVASGWKKSGGYNIEVNSAIATDSQIVITILETLPGANCNNTSVITQPYQIVQIEKTGKEYTFKTEQKVIDCKSE